MPTPLIPQEIYLLERYSSKAYYDQMRDAWLAMVTYVEDCLGRFMSQLPSDYRRRPQPEQPDIVWGQTVLPNFRATMAVLDEGYIRLTHEDYSGLQAASSVRNDFIGQGEFSYAWLDEVEAGASARYFDLLGQALHYASNIEATANASWPTTFLTTRISPERGRLEPPTAWPSYRLNTDVQVKTGDLTPCAGVYLPEVEDSSAQFLIGGKPAAKSRAGLSSSGLQYASKQPTLWTLIERAPGETVDDGLADLLAPTTGHIMRVPADQPCPQSGWWFTPAKSGSRRHFKAADIFPSIEGSDYGTTFWLWDQDQN